MQDVFLSARIPKQLKEKMEKAIEKGLYLNKSDLIRSAIRDKMKGEIT